MMLYKEIKTMYDPDDKYYPMLTRDEKLWDKVSHERLLELIKYSNKVVEVRRDTNNYGEFLFVILVFGKSVITFWGAGYHENRDSNINSFWYFYNPNNANFYRAKKALNKNKVLDEISWEVE